MNAIPEIRNFEQLISENTSFNKNWKYLKHSSRFLTAPGENYGSIILSVDLCYEENNTEKILKLVAKMCPPTDLLKEAFLCNLTFKKEALAYTNAVSTINHFQNELKISEENRLDFFPKCYGTRYNLSDKDDVDNDAVILLENLKVKGYSIEDRMIGFDFQTSWLILKNLAQLHATIITIRKNNPDEFENNILPSLKTVNNGAIMIDGFIGAALELMQTIEECKPYLNAVKTMANERKNIINGLQFPIDTNPDFYTMIHTDFWTNNIMILKNNEGIPVEAKMIDLQLLDYGSAVRDILFFIYSSVQIKIFENHFNDLLKFYYECFYDCLKNFHCNADNFLNKFTWELFLKEVNDVAPHELFHILFMLKPIFSERGSVENLDALDVKDFERTDNLGEIYLCKLKQIVLSFGSKNWIH